MNKIIIQLICPDQKGIIAQLTSCLYKVNANILSIEQHVDNKSEKFYIRIEADLNEINCNFEELKKELQDINLTLSGKLVTIDDDIFFLNPLTQKWETSQGSVTPLSFFNPEEGIKKILDTIISPSIESNSKTYWNIKGSMPASSLSSLIGETSKNDVDITIWIDKTTNYLTRAIIYGRLNKYDSPETNNAIQRIITISKINEALVIEHPLK